MPKSMLWTLAKVLGCMVAADRNHYLALSQAKISKQWTARVSFPAVDSAVHWLKRNHREILVGTVVVIAGVTFVVVVAGTGGAVLILAPAVLLASSANTSSLEQP